MATEMTYNVLVLDSDKIFLEAFEYALMKDYEGSSPNVVMTKMDQYDQISKIDLSLFWNHIIVNASFVTAESVLCFKKILENNPFCKIVLLISSKDGVQIKETIRIIDTLQVTSGVEFILGDNITDSMKVTRCLTFVKNDLK